jgi:hypothetical protein
MLKNPELFIQGYHLTFFPLYAEIKNLVVARDWSGVDQAFQLLTQKDGHLFKFLRNYHNFEEIEFIISIRNAQNEWEEDGIWHDDGSRVFAFSLSLTLDSDHLRGGRLGIRRKGETSLIQLPTPQFGGLIMFLTGLYGFEHKIHQVTQGERIIIAGWCS